MRLKNAKEELNRIRNTKKNVKPCTGCGACVSICKFNAIVYEINEEGFYEAYIDKTKCKDCNQCKKVCYKFLDKAKLGTNLKDGTLYAAQSKNENTVKTCTSGGIAYEISKYGIENGYEVLGTIYDYKDNIARAIIVGNVKGLEKLKGSKYLQSKTDKAFQELIRKCKNNLNAKFIVFGTPCQIAGLSKLIEIEGIKNEIIKIDLFCHGIPSYLVWERYLDDIKKKTEIKEIDNIVFREKISGWHNYCMKIQDEYRTVYSYSEKDIFYKVFFDNILLNSACFSCEVRKEKSLADIRLGDFWGKRYANREDGVSAVLVNTPTGDKLIKGISKSINIMEKVPMEECLNFNSMKDYRNIEVREKYIKSLKQTTTLNKILTNYRKELELKQKIKIYLKEAVSILPIKLVHKIKKYVKR